MAKVAAKVQMGDHLHNITVTLRVSPITSLRMRAGLWVVRLGLRLAGFGAVKVVTDE